MDIAGKVAVVTGAGSGIGHAVSIEDFRSVVEINLIAPVYWALEMVGRIAEDRSAHGLGRWSPTSTFKGP
jgi:3-oxoacyl-[acyl-carrier protein] reductase